MRNADGEVQIDELQISRHQATGTAARFGRNGPGMIDKACAIIAGRDATARVHDVQFGLRSLTKRALRRTPEQG